MRYQGHMNWDLTIPGMLGYFAAMLYNPNNVAFEGSTATTILEIAGRRRPLPDARLHHSRRGGDQHGAIRPWGHITCDGTVANIEAIWSASNLKFFPLALRAALQDGAGAGRSPEPDRATPDRRTAPLVGRSTPGRC